MRDDLARMRRVLDRCHSDPALFNKVVLARDLWSKQVAVCDSIARHPITVVPAGRAVGKSFLLGGICLWWLYTRPNSLILATGPDHRQICSVLFKEIRRALYPRYENGRQIAPRLPLGYDHLTEGAGSPQRLELKKGTGWGVLGFACKSAEGLSGQHAENMLVIVDEASGVDRSIWESIFGAAATRYLFVGNPIKYDCVFRELNEKAEAGSHDMHSVRISSLDHPDADKEVSPVGAVSRAWLRQMAEIHGEGSPWWNSNVLGLFPSEEAVRFLPLAWLDACVNPAILDDELWRDAAPGTPRMGVDVGGGVGADRSTIVVRNDKRILEVFASEWHGVLDDAKHRLEPVVISLARKHLVTPDNVIYDKGGIIGRSFGSYLANHGFDGAVGYFGSGRGGRHYVNRRTSVAFKLKYRLDPARDGHVPFYCGGIAEWPALRQEMAELRSPTMEFDEGIVKQVIEEKSAMKARLHRSPDLLDALMMSYSFHD